MILAFLLLLLGGTLSITENTEAQLQSIGVCNGRVADNLPPPQEVIALYKEKGIGKMRIYDPDQATLEALRGSDIELMVGVPNEIINSLATDDVAVNDWIQTNILNYPDVKFRYIVVGNEIPSTDAIAQFVLPAMKNIYAALSHANQQSQIKVSTAIQSGLLGTSYPPSAGEFSPTARDFIVPIVKFLADNGCPLLANVYPYFSYIGDPSEIQLSYALFTSQEVTVRDNSTYEYKNLFDASLDAFYAALEKVGAPDLEIVVSESGWPSDGGGNVATVDNAQTYYNNLIMHVSNGTPKRPNKPIETYLFAMFDEDQKGPAETERHFGLFTPDKQPKYTLVSGKQPKHILVSANSSSGHMEALISSFNFFFLIFFIVWQG